MPVVAGGYCEVKDLRIGDMAYPTYLGTKEERIVAAAEEIDIALGQIYKTPLDFPDPLPEDSSRPSWLTIKKINWLIASGRIILDIAANGEQDNLHAYGKRMLDEGLGMLNVLAGGEIQLPGIERLPVPEGQQPATGPMIFNEDPESLVESFYKGRSVFDPVPSTPVTAYGHPRRMY